MKSAIQNNGMYDEIPVGNGTAYIPNKKYFELFGKIRNIRPARLFHAEWCMRLDGSKVCNCKKDKL